MCEKCWDDDKKKQLLLKNELCDGNLTPMMTLDQLKTSLFEEWLETGKTHFRIYKDVLFDAPKKTDYSWIANASKKQATIIINFL